MKIKKYNENVTENNTDEARNFIVEYVKNLDNMTMQEYFDFYFTDMRGVKTELLKDIKALCVNLNLDASEL